MYILILWFTMLAVQLSWSHDLMYCCLYHHAEIYKSLHILETFNQWSGFINLHIPIFRLKSCEEHWFHLIGINIVVWFKSHLNHNTCILKYKTYYEDDLHWNLTPSHLLAFNESFIYLLNDEGNSFSKQSLNVSLNI